MLGLNLLFVGMDVAALNSEVGAEARLARSEADAAAEQGRLAQGEAEEAEEEARLARNEAESLGDVADSPIIRVRHYSPKIGDIQKTMRVRSRNPYQIYVESPIMTPLEESEIEATAKSFFRPLRGRGGVVEFNVDRRIWHMEQDPILVNTSNAKTIHLWRPGQSAQYIGKGFPLDAPGVDPKFFDWKGSPL